MTMRHIHKTFLVAAMLVALLAVGPGVLAQTVSDMPASITYHDNGNGTGYYEIGTPQALCDLSEYVDYGRTHVGISNNCTGLTFKLTADIDMSNVASFIPIGDASERMRFKGNFDGCGHTITGLTINNGNSYRALFGYVESGQISNVTIKNANITGSYYVAGIVALLGSDASISNCHVICSSITTTGTGSSIGVIMGTHGGDVVLSDNTYHSTIVYAPNWSQSVFHASGDAFNIGVNNKGSYSGDISGAHCDYSSLVLPEDKNSAFRAALIEAYSNPSAHTAWLYSAASDWDGRTPDLSSLAVYSGNTRLYAVTPGAGISASTTDVVLGDKHYFEPAASVTLSGASCFKVTKTSDGTDVTSSVLNGNTLTMPGYDITVCGSWLPLQAQLNASSTDANNPTLITLTEDYTAGATDSFLEVPSGHHVILDLNGHTINRNLSESRQEGFVIKVNGINSSHASLVIRDSRGGGTITGGFDGLSNGYSVAGGIYVVYGDLTLKGGSITGNKCTFNGGGGIQVNQGTVTITGGSITGNVANTINGAARAGGGVYVVNSTLTVTGGSITGNGTGGYLPGSCPNVSGGIAHDYANGRATIKLGESFTLSGNFRGTYNGGNWSNTVSSDYLHGTREYIYIVNPISPTAPIAIDVYSGYYPILTQNWIRMDGADPEEYFVMTDSSLGLGIVNGETCIGSRHTITIGDSNISASASSAAAGKPITLSYNGVVPAGCTVVYVVNGTPIDGNTFTMPEEEVTINTQMHVLYIDADGHEASHEAITLNASAIVNNAIGVNEAETWYAVLDDYTFNGTQLEVRGTVNIILADGATFTVNGERHGIIDLNKTSLIIYGQSSGTGKLLATGYSDDNNSHRGISTENLIINGGTVVAFGVTFGINSRVITINGGTVTATATNQQGIDSNNITISGGKVTATSTKYEGIVANAVLTISGGTVTATGANKSGIQSETLFISGGTVTATSTNGSGLLSPTFIAIGGGRVETNEIKVPSGKKIVLGYRNSDDYIKCGSYSGSVQIADGQTMKDEDGNTYSGTLTSDDLNALAGKTLQPYIFDSPEITLVQGTKDGVTCYWGTFFNSAQRYTLPEGAAAYTMNADKHLYRLGTDGRTIPAGVAVVIIAEKSALSQTNTISLTKSNDTSEITINGGGNILRGGDPSAIINQDKITLNGQQKTPYVLSVKSGTADFYKLFFPFNATIPANKAYYVIEDTQ